MNSFQRDYQVKSRKTLKCGGFKGVSKALIYAVTLVITIDVVIIALLRLVTLFRTILGDGFTIATVIVIGIAITYCIYLILRKLLEI